ncbi:hypothetical protein [Pantoea cypripedii]|uniref:SIR2-like domain-containing protein n=1 Tax=Pantoea cypripedii TaxID=55209 RepID=A0A1X1ETD9_PANCY|nr:hypothetical protein [Pantoea cypripedii]MBP2197241.1 hypothetical protein [Pantoea cypripedii]ORM93163.1 hypothetical protein HA50_07325 [Pantoea cypripedii]
MGYMILLGAGASFGSGSVLPYAPPLGNSLFTKLEELGNTAASLPNELKDLFRENFESGMAAYNEFANGNVMSFQRELAGYLARFKPLQGNHYIRLIESLNNRRFTYCSLNYDLLFELSANSLGYGITYSNRLAPRNIRLLKIHGSCNFWPDLGKSIIRGVSFFGSFSAAISAQVKPLNQYQSILKSTTEDSIAPAIAMYAEGKKVTVCPDYVSAQQEMWNESINETSKIFIIGVRVHQADKHIWQNIGESESDIYYFGASKADEEEFVAWKDAYRKKNAYFRLCLFPEAIDAIISLTR